MISVALTTFQGEKYIAKQLDSILTQSRMVEEIIVVDDCSNDSTTQILDDYSNQYSQIKVFKNSIHKGFIENFHFAISYCNGDFIFLCDQDDIWNEKKVEKMMDIMEKNPSKKVLASSFSFIDSEGNRMKDIKSFCRSNQNLLSRPCIKNRVIQIRFNDVIYHNFCQGASLLIRKEIKDYYLSHYCGDLYHDYFLTFIGCYKEGLYFYNNQLFQYRLHSRNAIGLNKKVSLREKITIDYCLEEPEKSLNTIRIIGSKFELDGMQSLLFWKSEKFLVQYIDCIRNHKLLTLLKLNFSPWYFKLKTIKGRIVDILVVLTRK